MNAGDWKGFIASRRTLLVCLALAALTLAVYWPVRRHAFINYDDPVYVTENHQVQAGVTWPGLKWAFLNLHGEHTYWHPLTWVSHMLDCQLFGLNPGAHHLVNVAFHIANTLLLLVVLGRMTGAFWRSAMVAGLFALHPLQVDTVAWVTERKNVLSTFFLLLTVWAYARYVEARNQPRMEHGWNTDGGRGEGRGARGEGRAQRSVVSGQWSESILHPPSSIFYLLALLFFALGLMSKPALVTLPFVLLLLDYWPLGRLELNTQRPTSNIQHPTPNIQHPTSNTQHPTSNIQHPTLKTALHLLVEKLPFFALAAAAAFITIAGHHEIRAEGSAGLPWQWRAGNALVSYVRYLGKTFWPGHLSVFYPHPGAWPAAAVSGSALLLLAVSGWVIWRARRAPYLATGWLWFLGVLVPMIGIIQAGAQAMADRFAYVPLMGLFLMVVWGLAGRAAGRRRGQAALVAAGLLALGACAVLTGRQLSYWQNTTTLFEHALAVTRDNACAHFSLGNELADEGRVAEAMRHWEAALKIEPGRADILGRMAGALGRQGDYAGAVARYRQALKTEPDQAEVLNNLAWLRATCPEAAARDGAEAVRLAQKACALTGFRRTIMVGTLAAAYAEAGRFPEAAEAAQKACALAEDSGDRTLLERNRELLELYRAGKPYHEPASR